MLTPIAMHQLVAWDSAALATWERAAPTTADPSEARIALLSPLIADFPAAELIPTWAATTPPGSWIEVQLRSGYDENWGPFFHLAAWDNTRTALHRTSFAAQATGNGYVSTDVLILHEPPDALQARVLLCAEPGADMPELEALQICMSTNGLAMLPPPEAPAPVAPIELPLLLSQYSYAEGEGWCSPTALTMVLAYWHARTGDPRLAPFREPQAVPELTAPLVHDPAWEGTGNWAFNTAFAASLGLRAYVTRMQSLEQLVRWTAAGVPVIISAAWQAGEISGAPGQTSGHLTLVRGFGSGEVLMAEPAAADPAGVLRAYPAAQLYAAWQRISTGTVYLIYPPTWQRPEPGPGDAWA